ncbi:multicopper oxidase [Atractiella rhizophila]|nr:multicopper oxidase [Atractiella rhizophila]
MLSVAAFSLLSLLPLSLAAQHEHELGRRTASYDPVTTVTQSTAVPIATVVPIGDPRGPGRGLPPRGQQYRLNSSFEITDTPATRSYDWLIAAKTAAPDGYSRNLITINGLTPGPLIEANVGDTVIVNITNTLASSTSVHWHGMYQNSTPWMDGVPGMTQCPIPAADDTSNGTFVYEWVAQDYGTYWYHSHSAVQYTDGLQGPLIIHSPDDPLKRGVDFDIEEVIMMADWYHDEASTIVNELLDSGYQGSIAAPSPQSALLNGQGIYNCSLIDDSLVDDTSGNCTTPDQYPVFAVDPATKYRIRLINSGSHAQFYFSVDEHTLNVTEADSTPVSGADAVHRVPIHNGQRYSVIVDTSSDTNGTAFYMRAEMNTDCFAYVDPTLNTTAVGILSVQDGGNTIKRTFPRKVSVANVTSSDWSDALPTECIDMDDDELVPIVAKDAPTEVGKRIAFDSAFGLISVAGETEFRFMVNSTPYTNYVNQPLLATINAGGTANASAVTTATFEDEYWVGDILINNLDRGLDHPYHLHGYTFYVVARGTGELSLADAANLEFNTTNPVRRDTVVIPGGGYAVLRFANDNPGVWVVHCHIAWHLASGFLAAIITRPNDIAAMTIPSGNEALCSSVATADLYLTEPGKKRSLNSSHGGKFSDEGKFEKRTKKRMSEMDLGLGMMDIRPLGK